MTSIKLKFRPSTTPGKEGSIVFQLIYGRTVRRITSRYKIFAGEWNGEVGRIALPTPSSPRYAHLVSVESALQWELNRLQRMVQESVPVNLDEIAANFSSGIDAMDSVFNFIRRQIHHKEQIGKVRSSETYRSMLNSFTCFRKGVDLTFDMMDGMLMELYEAWMRKCGLTRNSTSFYMRILRTNYKLAVEKGVTPDRHPFRKVYCGIDKTVKRSLPFSEIKKISALDLSRKPSMDFARDMFMFSFCTRGMSFIDMAYLKKKDLQNGVLVYRRQKTGQQLFIKWEKPMQEIVGKYDTSATPYLLPIIRDMDTDARKQYKNAAHLVNDKLKKIGRQLGLAIPLTSYVARHAWASIAKSKNIPISTISEAMGHDSENTTRIYLASLDTSVVDKANSLILKSL